MHAKQGYKNYQMKERKQKPFMSTERNIQKGTKNGTSNEC